jgi:ferredoxin-type protein NapH
MNRQTLRKLILLISFAFFPITVVYLAPAPPIMSLKAGVINLSVVVLVSIFLSGFIFRRAFCSWLCPGAGCQLVAKSINDKPIERKMTNWLRIIIVGVWAIMMVATFFMQGVSRVELGHPGAGQFATSEIRYFLPYIPVVIFMFIFVLLFGRRGFCYRGCWIYPIIAASTYIGRRLRIPSLHVAIQDQNACLDCKKCDRNCPMSIDVMALIQSGGTFPNHCVQCGTCIDSCTKDVLAYRFESEAYQTTIPSAPNVFNNQ